jgi:hypothetical protein
LLNMDDLEAFKNSSHHIWQSNVQETLFLNWTCKYVFNEHHIG